MKVSKLEGAQLDYWVGRANGWTLGDLHADLNCKVWRDAKGVIVGRDKNYCPSTNWAQGGQIIEREHIELRYMGAYTRPWVAGFPSAPGKPAGQAKTPLVAAMRAYVAGKFGEEVPDAGSIPDPESN